MVGVLGWQVRGVGRQDMDQVDVGHCDVGQAGGRWVYGRGVDGAWVVWVSWRWDGVRSGSSVLGPDADGEEAVALRPRQGAWGGAGPGATSTPLCEGCG